MIVPFFIKRLMRFISFSFKVLPWYEMGAPGPAPPSEKAEALTA